MSLALFLLLDDHSLSPLPLIVISSPSTAEFDRHELLIYEEVARMPPFRRKTLVLIGAQGVGRRSLKNRLIMSDPSQYGITIPCKFWLPWAEEKGDCFYALNY